MPITARLMKDMAQFTESLREAPKGYQGLRNFFVNTIDSGKALFADGVPKQGDLWGHPILNAAGLKVTERETFLMGGRDTGDGTGGGTRVQVLYETPHATPIRIPADVNAQWTDLTPSRGQFNQFYSLERFELDADGNPVGAPFAPIDAVANGDGAPVDYGIVEARVYTFLPLNVGLNLATLNRLMRPSKINDEQILLPPLYGDRMPMGLKKGECRYASYEPSVVGQFRQLVHVLEISEDFLFRWKRKDDTGQPTDPAIGDRVHHSASFNGLWRQ